MRVEMEGERMEGEKRGYEGERRWVRGEEEGRYESKRRVVSLSYLSLNLKSLESRVLEFYF